ncbi:hypothetical protein JTB14_002549 [Gonioctena quinquepunctata]|nr:hypothetical protein JTB14_002549 [Gonioctena quinquepunctata]
MIYQVRSDVEGRPGHTCHTPLRSDSGMMLPQESDRCGIGKGRLSHDEYIILASKIVQLFPTKTTGIYYVPAIKKCHSVTGKSIVAKGPLVDKCRNIIYKCDDAVTLESRKRKSWNSTQSIPKETTDTGAELREDENYIWLLHNSDPWITVENKWDLLYHKRREQKCESAAEFLKLVGFE